MQLLKLLRARYALCAGLTLLLILGAGAAQAQSGDAGMSADRAAVYAEMEAAMGSVPGFFKLLPDHSLRAEWETMQAVQMAPGAIPGKYRELIGLAVAAARGCEYCAYYHTQFARVNGATDAEIEDAVHFAKSNVGWSTYLHGMQYDLATFKKEIDQSCDYVRAQATKK